MNSLDRFDEISSDLKNRDMSISLRVLNTYILFQITTFDTQKRIISFEKVSGELQKKISHRESKSPFITKLEDIIAINLQNEQFGVEQLADEMGMSRSHLHRKLQKARGKSISRFIREYRLEEARTLLNKSDSTSSEIAYAVGFSSASYFSKCFTEYFGHPPSKTQFIENGKVKRDFNKKRSLPKKLYWSLAGAIFLIMLLSLIIYNESNNIKTESDKSSIIIEKDTELKKSLMVMPIRNLSDETDNDYLAFGLEDALNRNLGNIENINLISPLAFDPKLNNSELINSLGKRYKNAIVLMGSLQPMDSMLHVEFSVIEVATGRQLWAKKYNKEISDLLKIENQVAKDIALALDINLTSNEKESIDYHSSYNPEAYDHYLKGIYYSRIYNNKNQELAYKYLTQSIKIDSTMAISHLGLATYYHVKASIYFAQMSCLDAMSKAKHHIDRAQMLDSNLIEVKAWRAYQNQYYYWKFNSVEEGFKIGMNNELIDAYNVYITFLLNENRPIEAFSISKELEKKHPYYPNNRLILTNYYINNIDEAGKLANAKINTDPNNYIVLDDASFVYLNSGEFEKSIDILNRMINLEGKFLPKVISYIGAAEAKLNNKNAALAQIKKLREHRKTNGAAGSPAFFIAIIHSALGEYDEALNWLEISIDDHEMEVPWLVSEPQLYPLHGHPRFDALVKRVGFRKHAYPIELPQNFNKSL